MMDLLATTWAQPLYREQVVQRTVSEVDARSAAGEEKPAREETGFAGRIVWVVPSATGQAPSVMVGCPSAEPADGHEADADKVTRERLVFLSRKYAGREFGAEAQARLEILSERVRRLIPRITADDFAELERAAADLAAIQAADKKLEQELVEIERNG
jgi:hypothetical protein